MEIKTKYDIGQEVYITSSNSGKLKVREIRYSELGVGYILLWECGLTSLEWEDDIFPDFASAQAEARKRNGEG